MFDIAFTTDIPERQEDTDELGADASYDALWCRTTLGDDWESFLAPLGHPWARADYERHWLEAARRLVDGAERTAFFTQAFWMWWAMWREGEDVYVHEQILPAERYAALGPGPLDLTRAPYALLGPRETHTKEGQAISEWRSRMGDIPAFVARPAAQYSAA